MKAMGAREILEIYLNSAYKIISETEIFPHETKTLLTSVICFVMSVRLSVLPSVGLSAWNYFGFHWIDFLEI